MSVFLNLRLKAAICLLNIILFRQCRSTLAPSLCLGVRLQEQVVYVGLVQAVNAVLRSWQRPRHRLHDALPALPLKMPLHVL